MRSSPAPSRPTSTAATPLASHDPADSTASRSAHSLARLKNASHAARSRHASSGGWRAGERFGVDPGRNLIVEPRRAQKDVN